MISAGKTPLRTSAVPQPLAVFGPLQLRNPDRAQDRQVAQRMGFPLRLSAPALADWHYCGFVLEGFREICRRARSCPACWMPPSSPVSTTEDGRGRTSFRRVRLLRSGRETGRGSPPAMSDKTAAMHALTSRFVSAFNLIEKRLEAIIGPSSQTVSLQPSPSHHFLDHSAIPESDTQQCPPWPS